MPITTVKPVAVGIFPLDEQWQLDRSDYSGELSKRMVWLSTQLPYQSCQEVFARIGECEVPASSIWRQTQRYGERLATHVEHQQDQVSVERVVLPDARLDHDEPKVVLMDGGFVNIREQGWRELKVGAIADVEVRLERNPQTQDFDELAHGVNVAYTSVLGTKEDFTPALWALAVKRKVPTALKRTTVGDGALWIWNVAEDVCPDGTQIVDWFHAVEHLAEAAQAIYPDAKDDKKRQRWLQRYKEHLYHGRIHKIVTELTKQGYAEKVTYFDRHQRRMQYHQFREEGLPIGSGTVESGVKQFKVRLCGTGMRWHEQQAKIMIILRSVALNNEFDELWEQVA